mmetsp:Transcript_7679/g.18733  ORF Transcript_7679/g.18733 Transcript_7679/m.18733 type:complete len:358 (+) Transcript_7679:110-1183(+)
MTASGRTVAMAAAVAGMLIAAEAGTASAVAKTGSLRAVPRPFAARPRHKLVLKSFKEEGGREMVRAERPLTLRPPPSSLSPSSSSARLLPELPAPGAPLAEKRATKLQQARRTRTALVTAAAAAVVAAVHAAPALAAGEVLHAGIGVNNLLSGGFLQASSLVLASEIGDKTFFIAALLAMRASRFLAFSGSMLALGVMTVISVLIGQVFHNVPSSITGGLPLDDYAAIAFLGYFGVKSLVDAYNLPDNSGVDDELEEAEEDITKLKGETQWQTLVEAFTLVFTAELGDRSFLATIALSAAQNPFLVAIGAIFAHSIATGIAVASGAFLAKYINEKVVGYVGGTLFIAFAITTAFGVF